MRRKECSLWTGPDFVQGDRVRLRRAIGTVVRAFQGVFTVLWDGGDRSELGEREASRLVLA